MKKKLIIIFAILLILIILSGLGTVIFYNVSLKAPASSKNELETVTIVIEQGQTSRNIIDTLYNNGLIRNKYVGYVYLKLNNDFLLQAGVYDIKVGMDLPEILEYIGSGKVRDDSISVTFIEGKRLTSYATKISETFGYSEVEIMNKLTDSAYLEKLIAKYWFLTDDILNDKLYYALEGYLYPSTYQFERDASIEDIIEKMLDTMGSVLKNYESEINASEYNVREILTLASVIQNEGKTVDFSNIASVFQNRMDIGMKLESCATSYYGAKKDFTSMGIASDALISDNNNYNTYLINGLPIGPISSPSKLAIEAALKPSETEFYFFLSDNEGTSYFFKTYAEHQSKQRELVNLGKWAR